MLMSWMARTWFMTCANPLPYPSESVDEIFASHIIEHFSPYEWPAIKKD